MLKFTQEHLKKLGYVLIIFRLESFRYSFFTKRNVFPNETDIAFTLSSISVSSISTFELE